jgi:hypothetical protein
MVIEVTFTRTSGIRRRQPMLTRRGLPTLVAIAVLALTHSARAFERQWHVGGGVGFAAFADPDTSAGPAFGIHGAYGLSDVFDLKLDLLTSSHTIDNDPLRLLSGTAGIAYKMDVIRWIPYFGVQLGYYRLGGSQRPANLPQNELGMSVDLGVDYAVKRAFGLGLQLRYHGFLGDPLSSLGDAPLFTGLFRAEYRWGW